MMMTDYEIEELEIKKAQYALGDKKMKEAERLQYSINGDSQGCFVKTGMKKLRSRQINEISTNEWQAMIAASNSLRDKGDSDGTF